MKLRGHIPQIVPAIFLLCILCAGCRRPSDLSARIQLATAISERSAALRTKEAEAPDTKPDDSGWVRLPSRQEAQSPAPASPLSGTVVCKDAPEAGDLICSSTFYARIPQNRYGGCCEEDDYAPGRFLLWVLPVERTRSGGYAETGVPAVPYIVSDEGNGVNLSMLSGGWDGPLPYGDRVLRLTTDEMGEIIDAVFVQ